MSLFSFLGNAIGGLFGAGASIYGANQNVKAQEKANEANILMTRETNQANRDLAEYAYSQNLAQWNRENEFNSPQAQLDRLRSAGLNPNLIYNNSSAGVVSAGSPQYNPPEMRAAHIEAAKLNLEGFARSIANIASQTELNTAKAEKLRAETAGTLAKTSKTVTETEFLQKSIADRLEIVKQDLSQAIANSSFATARSVLESNKQVMSDAQLEAINDHWGSVTDRFLDIIKTEDRQRELGIDLNEQKYEVLKKHVELANKDMLLKDDVHAMNQFEIGLNKIGLTRSDDVYWRLLYQFGSWWLNNAGEFGDMFTPSGTAANGAPAFSPTAPLP